MGDSKEMLAKYAETHLKDWRAFKRFIRKKVEKLIRLMDFRLRPAGMTNKNNNFKIVILGLDPGIHGVST